MSELIIKKQEKKQRRVSAVVTQSTYDQMAKVTEVANISINELITRALELVLEANKDLIMEYDRLHDGGNN